MSFLFLPLSLFMTAAFFSNISEALVESSEPGPAEYMHFSSGHASILLLEQSMVFPFTIFQAFT